MSRLVPAIRQKLIETKNLLDRARTAGEDVAEVVHVAKAMLIEHNIEYGRESLSGLLALAADAAKKLEEGVQVEDDATRTFESMELWLREATVVIASMRNSMNE